MNICPHQDRVVLSPIEDEKKSIGGIVIPDNAATEKPMQGKVIAVGPGKVLENGDQRPVAIKIGARVLYGKYAGTEVKLDGETYIIMREDDILGSIE